MACHHCGGSDPATYTELCTGCYESLMGRAPLEPAEGGRPVRIVVLSDGEVRPGDRTAWGAVARHYAQGLDGEPDGGYLWWVMDDA